MTNGMKVPPQSNESEMALLGSIMIKNDALHEIMDKITPESFYADRHAKIYQTMLEMNTSGKPIDIVSLSEELKVKKMLDSVGGSSYLSELLESVPSSENAPHYADIIEKKKKMRDLISASEYISQLGYSDTSEIEEALDSAEKKVFAVTNFVSSNKLTALKESIPEAFERLDKLHKNKGEVRGIPTGFTSLDNKLSGLQKSDLIILAARPSFGKTSLALDIARQTALKNNEPVAIFSLEMSAQQLIDRMLASEAQVDSWKLRTGNLNMEEASGRIRDALDELSKAPIFVDDEPGNNILKMKSVARRLKSEKGLGLVIVDYLQLMSPTQSKNSDNVVQQVTEISRSLKGMARELDVPVMALSQLSRAVEARGGKPRLSDLRDSGSIEQDADVVMFLHRPDKYLDESEKTNIVEILIEKHRNGPTGVAQLFFDEKKSSFVNLDKEHSDDLSDF
jgi:replicative DNA helicase